MGSGTDNTNVEIKITGTVDSSLGASTTEAAAKLNTLNASAGELKISAAQMAQAIQATGGDLRKITPEMLGMGAAATTTAAATEGAAAATIAADEATKNLRFTTSGMIQEYIRMGRAIASGRFDILPSELATAASRMGGLSGATLAAYGPMLGLAAALVAVVGGLAYLTYQQDQAKKNLTDLAEGFALTGRASTVSADGVRYQLDFLSQLPGSTREAADAFLHLVSVNGEISQSMANQVGQLLPALIDAYGKEAPKAAEKLAAELSNLTVEGFQKLDREMLNLSPDQYEMIQNLIKTGHTAKAVSLILQHLSANSGVYIKSLGDQVYDIEQKIEKLKKSMTPAELAAATKGMSGDASVQQLEALQKGLANIRSQESTQGQQESDTAYKKEIESIEKINEKTDERTRLNAQLSSALKAAQDAEGRSDTKGVTAAMAAVNATRAKLAELDKKDAEQSYQTFTAAENAKAQAFASGSAQRIAIAQAEVSKAKEMFGTESKEYQEAVGRLNSERRAAANQETALARKTSSEVIAAMRATEDAGGLIGRHRLEAEIAADKTLIADARITASDKLEIERDLNEKLSQLHQLDQTRFEQWARKREEITKKVAREEQQTWEGANRAVLTSEDQFISGLFTKRLSLGQRLLQAGLGFLKSELQQEVRYWTERELLAAEGQSVEQMHEKAGLITTLIVETQKTSAHAAGVAARVASTAAGARSGRAIEAATASKSIISDAARAASGSYAALASIPYIGPALGAAAAVVAFSAVMAYESLVGLDVGAVNIPRQQPYMLHRGEMVVPANFAEGIRRGDVSIGGGGSPGGAGASVGLNVAAIDARSFLAFLNNPANMRILASRLGAAMNLNPSYRPNF